MGFFDIVGDVLTGIGKAAATVVADPKFQYETGKAAGLGGHERHRFHIGPNDGSNNWKQMRTLEKAYNSGYDEGKAQLKRSRKQR